MYSVLHCLYSVENEITTSTSTSTTHIQCSAIITQSIFSQILTLVIRHSRVMGYLLWIQILIYVMLPSLKCGVKYCVILNCIIMEPEWPDSICKLYVIIGTDEDLLPVFPKSRQHVCFVRRRIQMSDVRFVKIISIWCLSVQFVRRSMKSIREDCIAKNVLSYYLNQWLPSPLMHILANLWYKVHLRRQ